MAGNPLEVFVAAFDNEEQAGDALKDFRAMDRGVDRTDRRGGRRSAPMGRQFEETADPSGEKWAKRGAIAGGLVGLIFPSIIGTALVGAAGGGIWGKVRDRDSGRGPQGDRRGPDAGDFGDHRGRGRPRDRAAAAGY